MRLITTFFFVLVVAIQYPLWFGRGGWLRTHEMRLQLQAEQQMNLDLRARNDKLAAEVKDLREGAGAVEERARYELGMIKGGEIFVQIVDPAKTPAQTSSGAASSLAEAPGIPVQKAAESSSAANAAPELSPKHP